jgi:hypothetical protein
MKNRVIAALLILLLMMSCLIVGVFGAPEDTEPAPEETAAETTAPAEDPTPAEEPSEEPAEPVTESEPVEEPPAEEPTVEEPPVEEPTVEEPPVEEPTTEAPPVEESPAEEPPAEEPPVEEPGDKPETPPVQTGSGAFLTITREGAKEQPACYCVEDGKGVSVCVVIPAGETSVKLAGLRAGETYTVTELAAWSWRQPKREAQSVTAAKAGEQLSVTFAAVRAPAEAGWLSGSDAWEKEG